MERSGALDGVNTVNRFEALKQSWVNEVENELPLAPTPTDPLEPKTINVRSVITAKTPEHNRATAPSPLPVRSVSTTPTAFSGKGTSAFHSLAPAFGSPSSPRTPLSSRLTFSPTPSGEKTPTTPRNQHRHHHTHRDSPRTPREAPRTTNSPSPFATPRFANPEDAFVARQHLHNARSNHRRPVQPFVTTEGAFAARQSMPRTYNDKT